ncbi:MAG: AAA family ATPase [Lachnospiraceae bacterium]|nr:AAA family ATPase [Lachnospiraceae bacterium]
MNYTKETSEALSKAFSYAEEHRHQYITPEHIVYGICNIKSFEEIFLEFGGNIEELKEELVGYLEEYASEKEKLFEPIMTIDCTNVIEMAGLKCMSCGRKDIELSHILSSVFELEDSYAAYFISKQLGNKIMDMLGEMSRISLRDREYKKTNSKRTKSEKINSKKTKKSDNYDQNLMDEEDDSEVVENFRNYTECLNDTYKNRNELIGRTKELERTIQILCRKDKNNVLHIGEAGVGKTAIAYGLAALIEKDEVPVQLKGAKIYGIDMGTLVAGTQYRGDFEKRLKSIMDGVSKEEKPIIYIDEIHNIVGAGATSGGSLDASNMLKPYLAEGKIRFIGATTFEEYKKNLEGKKSLVRRFKNVDINEPSIEECVTIINGLIKGYERFHGVKYAKGVVEYAVEASAKYINDRYLPDKAIDLIDEAGARMSLEEKKKSVDKKLIDTILAQTCNIPKKLVEKDDVAKLKELEKKITGRIFGQDEACREVLNAVKFAKAGLNDESKPLASLLFVGATGVGKTALAKEIADGMGIKLIRFDMSEYSQKQDVSKLIGSPAGYVGYEEGGLFTDEVRKNPNCVVLLDEIEKAHPDIFNMLLQVMDYATLTDNKGRKADFRNAIIIMTSNAGATDANKPRIGFGGKGCTNVEAIEAAVKKAFTPEFRNRLSKIVVFNSMDDDMAEKIVLKKLDEFGELLKKKNVSIVFTKKAREYIKNHGITNEYGARQIDRVINSEVKTLLVDELLYGSLRKGGKVKIDVGNGGLKGEIVNDWINSCPIKK